MLVTVTHALHVIVVLERLTQDFIERSHTKNKQNKVKQTKTKWKEKKKQLKVQPTCQSSDQLANQAFSQPIN